jgi:hypothetical protein
LPLTVAHERVGMGFGLAGAAAGELIRSAVGGSIVGNRRAREFALQQERAAQLAEEERAAAEPRPAGSRRHLTGLGSLRLQLIVLPSFEEPRAWEVRQREQQWSLFRSRVAEPGPDVKLVGFDRVPFESDWLRRSFQRVTALTLPLGPDLDGFGGADGNLYQLAVFGDVFTEFRFQWWSAAPPQWQPLVSVANEMIQAFLLAEGRSGEQFAGWPV